MKIVVLASMILGFVTVPAQAQGTIEAKYDLTDTDEPGGPWSNVVYDNGADTCDPEIAPDAEYTFVYSDNIGAFGAPHPVVVWGNGTALKIPGFLDVNDITCYYRALLEHFASWGFVVVAPNDGYVGSGQELLAAVEEIRARASDPASPFFNKVDLSNISAVGHSQGATGVINAAAAPNSPITSVLSLSTPDPFFCNDPRWDEALRVFGMEYDCGSQDPLDAVAQISAPIFFVRGINECMDSDSMRFWFSLGLIFAGEGELAEFVQTVPCISSDLPEQNQSDQDYFDRAPGPAAKGTASDAGHLDLSNAIGYSTAWLGYTLENTPFEDTFADTRGAFVGNPSEIETNTRWSNWAHKNLP